MGIIGPMMKIALDEIPPFSMRVSEPHARPYLDIASLLRACSLRIPRLRTSCIRALPRSSTSAFSVLIPLADQCRDSRVAIVVYHASGLP
jgi:hypothetical protein